MTKKELEQLEKLLKKQKAEKAAEKKFWTWADEHKEELLERWAKKDAKAEA